MTDVDPALPRRSLRSMVNIALAAAAIVLAFAVLGGIVSFLDLNHNRKELVDRLDPAVTHAARLRAATGDQQSGVRGFGLTGDPSFLGPWDRGLEEGEAALAGLRRRLAGRDEHLRSVEEVADALQVWQDEHARPLIQVAVAGGRPDIDAWVDSRFVMTEVRTVLDDLVHDLDADRGRARAELVGASTRMAVTLGVVGALLAAIMLGVLVGLRRFVLRPMEATVEDARRIAGGDLDHVPASVGWAELAELGQSLDRVRSELVAQLRAVEEREADLARSNGELEQFAYVASHDLQEPLRKVASFCQMLERRYKGQLDERADTYIAFAVDGATRMQDLINDLLTFSRVGRTTERFEKVDLDGVLDSALRNLSSAIDDAGATIVRSPLPAIVGDRILLVALFQNLVGNSIKFRGEEPPVVRVGATEHDDYWEFTVSDNGIGIPEEYRDRIFVIFQRLHGRQDYPGTGIGLSLCRKIVEFHGGRIGVAEPDGDGTTIRFSLRPDTPLEMAAAPHEMSLR